MDHQWINEYNVSENDTFILKCNEKELDYLRCHEIITQAEFENDLEPIYCAMCIAWCINGDTLNPILLCRRVQRLYEKITVNIIQAEKIAVLLRENDLSNSFQSIDSLINEPPTKCWKSLVPLLHTLKDAILNQSLVFIAQTFVNISVQALSRKLGVSPEITITECVKRGWVLDETHAFLTPVLTKSASHVPPVEGLLNVQGICGKMNEIESKICMRMKDLEKTS